MPPSFLHGLTGVLVALRASHARVGTWATLADSGRDPCTMARNRARFGRARPKEARDRPTFVQRLPQSDQMRPVVRQVWHDFRRCWTNFAPQRANASLNRPMFSECWPMSAKVGTNSAKVGATLGGQRAHGRSVDRAAGRASSPRLTGRRAVARGDPRPRSASQAYPQTHTPEASPRLDCPLRAWIVLWAVSMDEGVAGAPWQISLTLACGRLCARQPADDALLLLGTFGRPRSPVECSGHSTRGWSL